MATIDDRSAASGTPTAARQRPLLRRGDAYAGCVGKTPGMRGQHGARGAASWQ
jgi:hypothetical protein